MVHTQVENNNKTKQTTKPKPQKRNYKTLVQKIMILLRRINRKERKGEKKEVTRHLSRKP